MDYNQAFGIVRLLINSGLNFEEALNNPAIPREFRQSIREALENEENIILEPAHVLKSAASNSEWLMETDRSSWYYWPTLRNYLLAYKNWPSSSVKSLDESTDRIFSFLGNPSNESFNNRGLVIGYVQSGKTANYTALIAKAADVGYRLIIVLAGIDNGLRRQTQIRLNKELVGYVDNRPNVVPLPPNGKQWHQFTTEGFDGDFRAGFANYASLQGTEPVLLVIKKNSTVFQRLFDWLDEAPTPVSQTLPVLVIDDEADQASIDTRGSYQTENEQFPEDYEDPSIINSRIRELLRRFNRCAYVAYTATPFANILIPHDTYHPDYDNDLYPKDFIIDLPKPYGYFGAEEQFGRLDANTNEQVGGGIDIIRNIPNTDLESLIQNQILPFSLETAMLDFVLAGAARAQRGFERAPATMLLHGSHLVYQHMEIERLISERFLELRDEWRYQRPRGILQRLHDRWENDFRPVTRDGYMDRDVEFSIIQPFISHFFESVRISVINSATGNVLDYEHEPELKTIAIGGNRLSRGLTLEGLLVSYFFRPTAMYDTLMQMGRWFGFRGGYEDLTRIYMTSDLQRWFFDLASVEHELRQDIRTYELQNLTPLEMGTRIVGHPAMLVTSHLKQRFSREIIVVQNLSNKIQQTFRFPFQRPTDLNILLENNLNVTRSFISNLGTPTWDNQRPIWKNVRSDLVKNFLSQYQTDGEARNIHLPIIIEYINRQNEIDELINWTVVVRGRETADSILGSIELGLERSIPMMSRNRLAGDQDSLGVITNPGDEEIGLTEEQLNFARNLQQSGPNPLGANPAARLARPPSEGLLLIYPVSRFSGHEQLARPSRRKIYENTDDSSIKDIICIAISFPDSKNVQLVRGRFIIGTVDWRPI